MISCKTMRAFVVLSASLLLLGTFSLLLAETTGPMVPLAHAAFLLVLGGAAVLAVAFIVAVFPGSARRLGNCQH